MSKRAKISNELSIRAYMHCALCLEEKPADQSPQDWTRNSVGWSDIGFQVWCNRHSVNVCHVDFEGVVHSANQTRRI